MNGDLTAIDPGHTESAYITIDISTRRPLAFGKIPNDDLLSMLAREIRGPIYVEMIASYGMAVGAEVFETCVWIGRFLEAAATADPAGGVPERVFRKPIKRHFCGTDQAKDPNVSQALKDRFAMGQPNHGKGTKAAPGWFYGFKADVWAAYALAVYAADQIDPQW